MDRLDGKTAVVTGAASGLGKAFAERFARAGMKVVLADIEEPALSEAVGNVQALGAEAIGVVTDVAREESVAQLAAAAIDRFGRVNVVCNNAGVASSIGVSDPAAIAIDDWRWVVDVNLWGVVHGHKAFLGHLLDHGDGHIVNTASMAGHFPDHSPYAASKWAVVGITEGLRLQLDHLGSTVGTSCLCPGFVKTRIAESARNRPPWAAPARADQERSPTEPQHQAFLGQLVSSGRPPEEVADLVHDAVLANQFWIFTDEEMVASLRARFTAVLGGHDPHWDPLAPMRDLS